MFQRRMAGLCLALAAGPVLAADPTPPSEIAALRQEIAAIRAAYEARLQALEDKLRAAEAAPAPGPTPAAAAAPGGGGNANSSNPAISLILAGQFNSASRDPSAYRIAGFAQPTGAELGPGGRGFSLGESELGLAASIDPWWRGVANISLHGDDSVSVEEAYVQTTALGDGLGLKLGRYLSGLGYLNSQHAHTWDFADNPLVYQALLGTQYRDDGLQLRWLAPTDQFLEFGLELGRGRGFPGGDNGRNGTGSFALTSHTGGDIGESSTWRAGLSLLRAKAEGQVVQLPDTAGSLLDLAFSGRTQVLVADAVWKWAPGGNATRTNFKLQGEWLQATRTGNLSADGVAADIRTRQSGWYLQGVYQFMPAWRVGLRTERLNPGQPDYGDLAAGLAREAWRPRKTSLMLDWSPSEFSRIRLQTAQDRARPGPADTQWTLQYQMSLGAHGAHSY